VKKVNSRHSSIIRRIGKASDQIQPGVSPIWRRWQVQTDLASTLHAAVFSLATSRGAAREIPACITPSGFVCACADDSECSAPSLHPAHGTRLKCLGTVASWRNHLPLYVSAEEIRALLPEAFADA
jgi:hypothetical protein